MTRHILIWGWLRLFLGIMQTSLAVAGVWMLLTDIFSPVTWIVVGGASTATITSRFLYQGKSDPMIKYIKAKASDRVK